MEFKQWLSVRREIVRAVVEWVLPSELFEDYVLEAEGEPQPEPLTDQDRMAKEALDKAVATNGREGLNDFFRLIDRKIKLIAIYRWRQMPSRRFSPDDLAQQVSMIILNDLQRGSGFNGTKFNPDPVHPENIRGMTGWIKEITRNAWTRMNQRKGPLVDLPHDIGDMPVTDTGAPGIVKIPSKGSLHSGDDRIAMASSGNIKIDWHSMLKEVYREMRRLENSPKEIHRLYYIVMRAVVNSINEKRKRKDAILDPNRIPKVTIAESIPEILLFIKNNQKTFPEHYEKLKTTWAAHVITNKVSSKKGIPVVIQVKVTANSEQEARKMLEDEGYVSSEADRKPDTKGVIKDLENSFTEKQISEWLRQARDLIVANLGGEDEFSVGRRKRSKG